MLFPVKRLVIVIVLQLNQAKPFSLDIGALKPACCT
jgi:hypothetical protein